MILQALGDYYKRSDDLPREGWIRRAVDYELVLDTAGNCIAFKALGEMRKGKTVAEERLVIAIGKQAMKHTNSGKDANLLWDNASFVFGAGNKGATKLTSFIETLQSWLGELDDPGVKAVNLFCTQLQADPAAANALIERFGHTEDFEKRDPVLTFQLQGDLEGIHHRLSVRSAYEDAFIERGVSDGARGNCLVTGKTNVPIALNETVIKNVWGGQPAGCNIVSFNARAFESYGKTERQGENAPVSRAAAFAYTTALNHLLRKDSPQRMQVGDASTVFWAERQAPYETIFGDIFQDNPDASTDKVEALLNAVHSGHWGPMDKDLRYHVLGLAPNAARISIRFYHRVTLQELGQRIAQHFEDLSLVRGPNDARYPTLFRLLTAVALQNKADNIPPNLGGAVVDAILAGPNVPYPSLWLNAAVGRCRAEPG
jgi:CRISPR-associated protein Csd1